LWFSGTLLEVDISVCDQAWLTRFIGHRYLYERGVLHRDISPGNILIKWQPGSEADQSSTSGCLIDLDHAKRGKPPSEQVTAQPVDDDLNDLVLLWCSKKGVKTDVARQALVFFPVGDDDDAIALLAYLKAALAHTLRFRPLNGQLCTPQHLGWQSVQPRCSLLLQL
jgi:serine/threonine protein kinase